MMQLDKLIQENDQSELINILHCIQKEEGYLPENLLRELADGLGVPLSRIYSVATFFKAFSLVPRGRHIISVCAGTTCHVRGAKMIIEELERRLGIKNGETTPDKKFTLETVRCLGCCSLAPVVSIDGDIHGRLSLEEVSNLLERYEQGIEDED